MPCRGWAAFQTTPLLDVRTFGAVGNGVRDDTAAVSSALRSGNSIHFPPGTYLINNANGPLLIFDFSSSIVFEPGAVLSFTSPDQLGLEFTGGSGAKLLRVSTIYQRMPTRRIPGSVLSFTNTTNTSLNDVTVNGSPGGGVSFESCIRPVAINTTVSNTVADGLLLANSQNATIDGVVTNNTGDDGLAIHNFVHKPQESNGIATNIKVSNSKARGISCSGCKDLEISKFSVDNTSGQGVHFNLDTVSRSHPPTNVTLHNGTITNAGRLAPVVGNQFGLELNNTGMMRIANVIIRNSAHRGVSAKFPNGSTVFDNVTVVDSGNGGAGFDLQGQNITVSNSSATGTSGSCFAITYSPTVTLNNITGTNCSRSGGLNRAITLEQIGNISGDGIRIIDNQSAATGYVYFDRNVTSGFLRSVSYQISQGGFSFASRSPGLQIEGVVNMGSPNP